jgi:hypothetical protein
MGLKKREIGASPRVSRIERHQVRTTLVSSANRLIFMIMTATINAVG